MGHFKTRFTKNPVFSISAAISLFICAWGVLHAESFKQMADGLMSGLKDHFSWFYLTAMLFFLFFDFFLAFSKWGKVKLGNDNDVPEYSLFSWFAMLFAAGMGIGLVFWGVAEPLSHYVSPPGNISPETIEAEHFSIRTCFMHWGLHPWGAYALMGLGLALFQFRKKSPGLVSSLLQPFFRKRKHVPAWLANTVNIYTVILTVIGVATSLGMGCLQICEGLNLLAGIPNNIIVWYVFISIICVIYLIDAVSGIDKGIKILSNTNLLLFVGLMVLVFIIGSKTQILKNLLCGLGDYIVHFLPDSLRMSFNGDTSWILSWRMFYWAWWISWVPFVGVFIARISRGRTIREFIIGVTVIPTLVSCIWFAIMGTVSFQAAKHYTTPELLELISKPQTTLYYIFQQFPLGKILCGIAMILLVCFFITSADSATYVLAMNTSGGDLNPPNRMKIFWGILIAAMASVLISGGDLSVIQAVSIASAFPYIILLLIFCISLAMVLKTEPVTSIHTKEKTT